MKKIFFFSNNPNKIKEVLQILKNDLIKIKTLKKLLDEGVITQEEFTKAKKKLLN